MAQRYIPPHQRDRGGSSRDGPDDRDDKRVDDNNDRRGGNRDRRGNDDRRANDRRDGGGDRGRNDRGYGRDYGYNRHRGGDYGGGSFGRRDDRRDYGGGGYGRRDDRGYDRRGGRDYDHNYRRRDDRGGYGRDQPRSGRFAPPSRPQGRWSDRTDKNPRLEKEYFANAGKMTGINFDKYDDIPIDLSDPNKGTKDEKEVAPLTTFSKESVGPELMRNIELAKFTKPTPVQRFSIPICNMGRDLMACAQTGSGKTGGFLFPCISMMLKKGPPDIGRHSYRDPVFPTALILAPTRELAIQIFQEAKKFCYRTGIRPCVAYGGARSGDQLREMNKGVDMLVATPGRLDDFLGRGKISLHCTRFLVLDEADQMLDMGFEPQIRDIVERYDMPDKRDRQTMMFSATFPNEIQRLAEDFLENHFFLAVGEVGSAAQDVRQQVEYVKDHDKESFLLEFLNQKFKENPENLILCFVETKRMCDKLEWVLCNSGIRAASIHGDRDQGEREAALDAFRNGHRPVLVATSVASRGLDIPNVSWVVNFDMPTSLDVYVHRIGRTGRAGNVGNAMSLVNEKSSNIARDLYDRLVEGKQDPPSWLKQLSSRRGGGNRRGGGRFGGKDYRSNGGGSYRGGGGGGWRDNRGGSDNSAW